MPVLVIAMILPTARSDAPGACASIAPAHGWSAAFVDLSTIDTAAAADVVLALPAGIPAAERHLHLLVRMGSRRRALRLVLGSTGLPKNDLLPDLTVCDSTKRGPGPSPAPRLGVRIFVRIE